MARLPMIFSLLAVLLAGIFGFGLSQQMAGLNENMVQLESRDKKSDILSAYEEKQEALEASTSALQEKVALLHKAHNDAQKRYLRDSIHALGLQLNALSTNAGSEERVAKIQDAVTTLQDIVWAIDKELQE